MKRCNLAPEVRNGVGIIHIFRGQEADTGRPCADAPVNELFQVCTEAVSISEVQIRRERERDINLGRSSRNWRKSFHVSDEFPFLYLKFSAEVGYHQALGKEPISCE